MRIKLILLIVFLTGNFVGFTQQRDAKAIDILDKLSNKIKSYNTILLTFSNIFENKKEKIYEVKDGKLYLKGDKYKLEFKEQTIISDSKLVWTIINDANEVQVNNVNKDEDAVNPATIFTLYKKGYRSKFIKEENNNQIIDLVPIKGKSYYKVRLIIDKVKNNISECIVYEKNGSTFSLKVKEFKPNVSMSDDMFTFNKAKYPGIEVVDLR